MVSRLCATKSADHGTCVCAENSTSGSRSGGPGIARWFIEIHREGKDLLAGRPPVVIFVALRRFRRLRRRAPTGRFRRVLALKDAHVRRFPWLSAAPSTPTQASTCDVDRRGASVYVQR